MRASDCGFFGPGIPWALLVSFCLVGCAREPEARFTSGESLQKLPPSHQEQIGEVVSKLFATPANPRLAGPKGEDLEELVEHADQDRLKHGAAVFNRRCASCHGVSGDGNGEAAPFLQPKPRDYRKGVFKFTSTPYGAKPNVNDLARVIRRGAKGTSMPAFRFLPDEDVLALIDYVIMLSYRGELEGDVAEVVGFDYEADEDIDPFEFVDAFAGIHDAWQEAEHQAVLPASAQPKYSDETILLGRKAFLQRGCSKCHGEDGQGQTIWLSSEFIAEQESKPEEERVKINVDSWGQPAPAADLTAGMLHGGRRPIDIYRRIYTGINGTPMPAFGDSLAEEPDTIWHLVHYVISVVDGREVPGLDEIKAPTVEEANSPDSANEALGEN